MAKREIKETLIAASKLDINKEDNGHMLFSIIDGLKGLDTFKFNTRKQLMKINSIRKNLTSAMAGYVNLSEKIAVIIKDTQSKSNMYHELVHLTQPDKAYYVSEKYGYSGIFSKAMEEGEAVNCEFEYLKASLPETYIQVSNSSLLYMVFYEVYQDMKKILGLELLNKWKMNNTEDFIKEANEYTMKHYNIQFYSIYHIWVELLYRIILKSSDELFLKLAELDSKSYSEHLSYYTNEYNNTFSDETDCNNFINNCKSHINEIDMKLGSKELLEKSFNEYISISKKDLNDYILENGMDDYSLEWKREIDSVTIDYYIKILVSQKNDYYKQVDNIKKELLLVLDKRRELQWVESLSLVKVINDSELVNLKEKCIDMLSKDKGVLNKSFNITKRIVALSEENLEDRNVNTHAK